MTTEASTQKVVRYWVEKAHEAIASAQAELAAKRLSFAVNRLYYACFYIVSAVLLQNGLQFKKHSGVRAAFHQHFVKTGQVSHADGALYDELFEARQTGDYLELVHFTEAQVGDWLKGAQQFVATIANMIQRD